MTYKDAKQLHSEDEVIIKKTNEIAHIISVTAKDKELIFEVDGEKSGYQIVSHKDID